MLSKVIELKNIDKYYKLKGDRLHALKSINLDIEQGDFLMIMGKSGSGKTTLLNLLGFLDSFDSGNYIFNGKDVTNLNENEKSEFRNEYMGFIFQQFHLIESLTIGQNVELPLLYKGNIPHKERDKSIEKYLDMVGLLNKKNQIPTELSGGQQQRIAIARALINNPYVIFADEPTGALDSNTSTEIMNILKKLNEENKTIIMVTHDEDLVKYANKVINIKDGVITKGIGYVDNKLNQNSAL
ncbi:ABC transporter ATP-binding protein [Clostridium intestinale]|uniref:ABC transporter ATP-binding protein n=1 Tax=Clostridium intestinale TaxID=36845 RepID=UPI00311A1FCA